MNPKLGQLLKAGLLIGSWIIAAPSLALPDDREQAFQLQADSQTFDQKNGRVTYSGAARLQQGSMVIEADTITVDFATDNSVSKVTAQGDPAKFQQRPSPDKGIVFAEGQTITYDSGNNTVSLEQEAKLEQDGAVMRGFSIHYDLNRELVRAESDKSESSEQQRIQMTIPPAMVE